MSGELRTGKPMGALTYITVEISCAIVSTAVARIRTAKTRIAFFMVFLFVQSMLQKGRCQE
jgi:hypothetical protein